MGLGSAPAWPAAFAQQAVSEGRAAAPDGTVKITNAVGSVRVSGWDRDSVALSGTLGAGAERLEFSVEARETRIRVVVPAEAHTVGGSRIELRVPRGSHVAVRTTAADIEVEGVVGALDLESVSGGIRVTGTPHMVYAASAGGDVQLDVVSKVVRAKSLNGDVTVLRARGYLEVSTVSGAARVTGQRVWEGEITSVSGSIRFEGDFDPDGSFDFESHSGDIELVLPAGLRADFDLTTLEGGRVVNDFAPATARSFTVGGGGTRIHITSFKGVITLRRQS
jgi:DUF4097 and DUF4098 domain-containing protein YvlB